MTLPRQHNSIPTATMALWLPFAVWMAAILLVQLLQLAGLAPAWLEPLVYSAKTLLCGAMLVYFWPTLRTHLTTATARDLLLALLMGALVALLWILPETPWTQRHWPTLQSFYHRWFITPLGALPSYFHPTLFPELPFNHPALAFAPNSYGAHVTALRLIGSAFVIAPIEEFFFRGFLYDWLRGDQPPTNTTRRKYDSKAFWVVALLFAIEHDRWLLGLLAGLIYGALALSRGGLRTGALAHIVTNLLLGIYVITSGQYGFW